MTITSFVFSCIKSVHFPQGLSYSWKKHIDLFWHTQPSAERIKSIQGRVCTDSHVYTQTHILLHMDIAIWLIAFHHLSPCVRPMFCFSIQAQPNSKSEHSVQYDKPVQCTVIGHSEGFSHDSVVTEGIAVSNRCCLAVSPPLWICIRSIAMKL